MYTTYRESIFEPSQGVRPIIGVEAEMALRGTFKRVRICPGKGVNMPRTSLTTNGHNCNIVYLIHTLLFHNISKKDIARLECVQNCLARVVTKALRFNLSLPILKQLHWRPVKFSNHFKICTIIF